MRFLSPVFRLVAVASLINASLAAQAGIFVTHVPCKGTALAIPDVIACHRKRGWRGSRPSPGLGCMPRAA